MTIGGGFAPVTKHGYGVAYFFQSDNLISVHVSAFNESPRTDALRFYTRLCESFTQIETVCSYAMQLTDAECCDGERRYISYKDSVTI